MLSNVLFTYEYRGVEFFVIAQPIVENKTKKISSFELLSRCISIDCMENFFGNLSAADVTRISCIQMSKLSPLLSNYKSDYKLRAHINIHHSTLFNNDFMKLADKMQWMQLAFEMNGFECHNSQAFKLRDAFEKLKSLGHEIWLDDYGINNATAGLLLNLPWSGVKIDKGIVWSSTQEQLYALVHNCKACTEKVTLEGIEDEYLNELSVYTGADFSQGFNWELLKNDFFYKNKITTQI